MKKALVGRSSKSKIELFYEWKLVRTVAHLSCSILHFYHLNKSAFHSHKIVSPMWHTALPFSK